jgi:hypothetical protein
LDHDLGAGKSAAQYSREAIGAVYHPHVRGPVCRDKTWILQLFQIVVYADILSLQKNSRSLIQRYLRGSPWGVTGLFLALTGLAYGGGFFLSGKLAEFMTRNGQAEIYEVEKLDEPP